MSDRTDDPIIDPGDFRKVLGCFPTGVTVVTADAAGRPVGIAIGSFASISLDPPLVGFFLGTESGSWPAMEEAGHFCVNVLTSDQQELCAVMASRSDNKFEGVEVTPAPATGAPVLPGVHAIIDCRIDQVVACGDHNLVMGRVLHLDVGDGEAGPMVFHKGRYGSFAE
ncbi:MAG: flavin reductase family protein [Acidimicrobiales bacterium]